MAHDNMFKQIRMSLMIRHALRMLGVKVASNYRDINAIACAALVEGAMGLKRNSLARQMTVSGISKALAESGADRSGIDPEILDVGNSSGPINGATMKMLSKLVSEIRGAGHKGIEPDMFLYGLWDSGMLPGGGQGDDGFMKTDTKDFWYTLGKTKSSEILSGRFTMRSFINLTRHKLRQYGLNFQNNANRRLQDQTDFDTYEDASSPVSSESIITEFFKALDAPSHDLHNRAKEWWVDNIESTTGGVQLAVLQAFRALGATDDMSIKGGYKGMRGGNASASAWIEDNLNMTVSVKAIGKAWPKIRASFAGKFERGMSDSRYEDLWAGLQDKLDVGAAFSQNRGMQIQYDDSRMASVANRHAYRLVLRNRRQA